ncbi:alpha/beta hydrolase, partial [Micromonospora sp. NPDC000018]|uniref:alpha/beta hydrolase n=1 Tax=Micromonospora sp. NPDC000018 TaxID=3154239 RepID=UPI00332947BC
MALDPDVRQILAAGAGAPPLESLTTEQARSGVRGLVALQGEPEPLAEVRDVAATGEAGPVRVRLYRPAEAPSPAPVLLWAHGGGWIRGNLETWDAPLSVLARQTAAVVASVDYRLAPETRFPGPLHDLLAALRHLAEHAADLGLDPERIAVGGDSSGGNLA